MKQIKSENNYLYLFGHNSTWKITTYIHLFNKQVKSKNKYRLKDKNEHMSPL